MEIMNFLAKGIVMAVKIACVVFAAIGVYYVVKNRKRIWQNAGPSLKKMGECARNGAEAMVKENLDMKAAKEEFVKKCKSFTGIYESFHQIKDGLSVDSVGMIAEWNTRIHYLENCPNVTGYWDSLFTDYGKKTAEQIKEHTSKWLNFIYETGIKRECNDTEITVDETTKLRYHTLMGEEIKKGSIMKVVSPCWTFDSNGNNVILDMGIITNRK